jgi:hypothetical protein
MVMVVNQIEGVQVVASRTVLKMTTRRRLSMEGSDRGRESESNWSMIRKTMIPRMTLSMSRDSRVHAPSRRDSREGSKGGARSG